MTMLNVCASLSSSTTLGETLKVCLSSREIIWGGGEVFLNELGSELLSRGIEVCWRVEPQSELAARISGGQIVARRKRASYDMLIANDFRSLWQAAAVDGMRRMLFVGHGPWQFSPMRVRFIRLIRATTLVVSESVAADAAQKGLSDPIRVLPLGPGPWSSPPQTSVDFVAKQMGEMVFGSVARLDPIKRLPMFAAATHELGVRAVLVVPQPASDEESEILTGLAEYEHLELRVGGKVEKLWDDIDVFLSTSESESLGLAHLEALQHGVHVVSTAANGPHDFLTRELKLGWIPNTSIDLLPSEIKRSVEAMQACGVDYWNHAEAVLNSRSISRCADIILDAAS